MADLMLGFPGPMAIQVKLLRLTWCLMGPKLTLSEAKFHLVSDPPVHGPSTTAVPDLSTQVEVPVTRISPARSQGQGQGQQSQGRAAKRKGERRADARRRQCSVSSLFDRASHSTCHTRWLLAVVFHSATDLEQ